MECTGEYYTCIHVVTLECTGEYYTCIHIVILECTGEWVDCNTHVVQYDHLDVMSCYFQQFVNITPVYM